MVLRRSGSPSETTTRTSSSAWSCTSSSPGSAATTAAGKIPWQMRWVWRKTVSKPGSIRPPESGRSAGDFGATWRTLVLERPLWISPDMHWLELPAWITKKKDELRMNLKILRWLLAHKDVLLKVVDVVKPWRKDLPLIAQWEIVDQVARLVIPVITPDDIVSMLEFEYEDDVQAFAAGAEVQAMGIDWMTLVKLIIPVLEAVIRALADKDG